MLVGGVVLHFVAMAVAFWTGGMILDGFDVGRAAPLPARIAFRLAELVWLPVILLPTTPTGPLQHVLGILSAGAWVALGTLAIRGVSQWRDGRSERAPSENGGGEA